MAINWKQLSQAALTGAATLQYTAPTNTQTTITAATAWNPSGSPVVVDVFLGANGFTAGDGTHIGRVQVAAGATAILYEVLNHKLQSGQQIQALGNGCTLTLSGTESS